MGASVNPKKTLTHATDRPGAARRDTLAAALTRRIGDNSRPVFSVLRRVRPIIATKRFGVVMDPAYPRLPYGTDAKRSLIAKAVISHDGVTKVSFLPVLIDKELRPEPLHHGDPRFDDAVKFMDWVSEEFPHKFTIEGNEVVITGV